MEAFTTAREEIWNLDSHSSPVTTCFWDSAAERADVDLVQGKFFTQLFSLQADYNFTPNISWANTVQYDTESRILGFQTRFRWILKPGNDLFLVLNRGWFKTYEHDYVPSFDRGTVKLQYTFRF